MPAKVLAPQHELARVAGRSVDPFRRNLEAIIRAEVRGDFEAREKATEDLGELLGELLAFSDLLGRRRMLLEFDAKKKRSQAGRFAAEAAQSVPRVVYQEGINDLVRREPRLATTAEEVSALYQTEPVFAMARSTSIHVTRRVQKAITEIAREGIRNATAVQIIEALGPFTQAYAETVYRTNLATAYTMGRFEQARNPNIAAVIRGFERIAADRTARPNHFAVHGLIAGSRDPIWLTHSPPWGYNCRCSLRSVDVFELRSKGLIGPDGEVLKRIPPGAATARPDPGFERSPIAGIYG